MNSGLPNDKFVSKAFYLIKREDKPIFTLQEEYRTMIFYVSPHKLNKTLAEFVQYFWCRQTGFGFYENYPNYEETMDKIETAKKFWKHFEIETKL